MLNVRVQSFQSDGIIAFIMREEKKEAHFQSMYAKSTFAKSQQLCFLFKSVRQFSFWTSVVMQFKYIVILFVYNVYVYYTSKIILYIFSMTFAFSSQSQYCQCKYSIMPEQTVVRFGLSHLYNHTIFVFFYSAYALKDALFVTVKITQSDKSITLMCILNN